MAKKVKSKRFNPKTYKVYGQTPTGNWNLNLAMSNDYGLYQFVMAVETNFDPIYIREPNE